jgi:hypothetical protein
VEIDEQHIALPQLRGAPAYARPPRPVSGADRPFDPDELPLEVHQTDEELEFISTLPARAYASSGMDLGGDTSTGSSGHGSLRLRSFKLRAIAGRLRGGD